MGYQRLGTISINKKGLENKLFDARKVVQVGPKQSSTNTVDASGVVAKVQPLDAGE